MIHLEPVYLANVILYVDVMETIIKLIQVNKKCQEAAKMIRYYSSRKLYESDEDVYSSYTVIKNLFELFPNIETIQCEYKDIKGDLELFEKVSQIELNCFSLPIIDLPQEIKSKIIKLELDVCPLKNIRLNEFTKLKSVLINNWRTEGLKNFLGNYHLNRLIITVEDNQDLNCLKECKNIANKTVKIQDIISKERYYELKSFTNVLTKYPIDGMDVKETYGGFSLVWLSGKYDINRMYNLSLFTKCYVFDDCDLRNCELLEYMETLNDGIKKPSIQVKGLNHLKKMVNINKVDCIPPTVTMLAFNSSFDYKELLRNDVNCFINIKEVKLTIDYNKPFHDLKLLLNFKNCTTIALTDNNNSKETLLFPLTVKELEINWCYEKQMNEIAKLKELKKLSINFDLQNRPQRTQAMFDNFKKLESLKTNSVDGIKLPLSLTCLDLEVKMNTDLSQYTNLKEIQVCFYGEETKQIKLPPKLDTVYICGDLIVTNSGEVEIHKLTLINAPSQNDWKRINVLVKK